MDANGKLFDIPADPGQYHDVADRYGEIAAQLRQAAERHGDEIRAHFEANANRPFTVGFGPSTTLPARDGVEHGMIKRSSLRAASDLERRDVCH